MSIMYPFQLIAMIQNERKPLDSLKKMQNLRLSNLIRHAYENVPYYRNLFERENITPDDIKSIDDLVKIPVSTKADFTQVEPDDLIAKNYINAPLVKKRTSGSTGMPFVFAFSREDNIIKDLMLARIFLTNGFNIFKKRAHIMDPQSMTSESHWFQKYGIWRVGKISCFDEVDLQLAALKKAKPNLIYGWTSSILMLARELLINPDKDIKVDFIVTTAEMLTQESRKIIEKAFNGRVFDQYGASEIGPVSYECKKHDGYHISMDTVVMEFIKDGKKVNPGVSGAIVFTALFSFAMPFIRYSVGDAGSYTETRCECGRTFPRMSVVEGRSVDFITLIDGRKISPYTLTCAIENIGGIGEYKIIQEKLDKISIIVKSNNKFDEQAILKVKKAIQPIVSDKVDVEIKLVDEIKRGRRKFKIVTSLVND